MSIRTTSVSAAVGATPLTVKSAQVTLDEQSSPYCEALLTLPTPSEATLALLDPRDDVRVTVTLTQTFSSPPKPSQTRTFNLRLMEREVEAKPGETRLTLMSDEAYLLTDTLVASTPDSSAETYQTSLRDIVDNVLTEYGGALEASPAVDADYTITTARTNLFPNPSVETNTTGFTAGTGSSAVALSTTVGGFSGSASCRSTASAASHNVRMGYGGEVPTAPGEVWTVSVYARGSVARSATLSAFFVDSAGTTVGSITASSAATLSTTAWTRYSVTVTAPAGAAFIRAFVTATSSATGNFVYLDGVLFEKTDTLGAYFDGAKADDTYYGYEWSGTAHASTSNRVRLDNRDPELLTWTPGETAWDFLNPLVQTAGYRLFCDEQRKWRLIDNSYSVPGNVNVSEGFTLLESTDLVSLSAKEGGAPVFFDSVVVEYRWTDSEGAQQRAWDSAGASGLNGYKLIVERPYPGPGAAQAILDRAQGRGRVLTLLGLVDLDATPGKELSATIPDAPGAVAVVSAVAFDIAEDRSEMRLRTRGALDVSEYAWTFATGDWADQPAGRDWTEYTP